MTNQFGLFATPTHQTGSQHGPTDLITDLNPPQRAAVAHRGTPLLVVAGAGSGKTRVLTRRIAHLLASGDARPGEILAITFTNKAAAEMRERVVELVGPPARAMLVSTFHSMCVRFLRAQASDIGEKLGLSSTFTIYDQADSQRLAGMVAGEQNLDTKRYTPRALAGAISNLKNELITPADAADQADDERQRIVAGVYAGYQQRLRTAGALDFDDLIMRTVQMLQQFPAVAEYYRRRFRHILVDEYQDTNHAQYVLIRELVGLTNVQSGTDLAPAELVVVGDADQSIYAFRGATIRNIVEFERDFPDARTIMLEQNYRSTQNILSAANAVIAADHRRRPKNLWTAAGPGEKIVGYVADNEHDEARFISSEIDTLADSGQFNYGDVAVFYRTNAASRAIEDIFVRTGMPYRIVGGVRFYERREVKDVLAYLRTLSNADDEVNLRRVLNTPRRGIGNRAEATVAIFAEQQRISFAAALPQARNIPGMATRSATAIEAFVKLIDQWRAQLADGADPADLATAVLEGTGYRAELDASDDPQDAARVENLDQLMTVLREHTDTYLAVRAEQSPEDAVTQQELLSGVLEQISLVADADSIPDSADGVVTLMTLHTAKGLEFPVVFLTGLEDGVFPHARAFADDAELSEERRLAYVGITRAQQRLYLSRAAVRSAWGQPAANPASRFLADIPEDVLDWRRLVAATPFTERDDYSEHFEGRGSTRTWTSSSRSSPVTATRFGDRAKPRTPALGGPVLHLAPGDRVSHDKYGLGTVKTVDGQGVRATATVDFGSAGTVRLMLIGGVPMVKL